MTLGIDPISSIDSVVSTPAAPHQVRQATVSEIAAPLIQSMRANQQLIKDSYPPVDRRLQDFINKTFPTSLLPAGCTDQLKLPSPLRTFQIDKANVAFELACPFNANYYQAPNGDQNYRIPQGLLANPSSDKRSTVGTFHVCQGGAKISGDKLEVPLKTTVYMLAKALNPPKEDLELPFTANANKDSKAYCWTSVYLNPPAIPGLSNEANQPHVKKLIEVRYFAPGAYVANLGFVEQIFCNAGNPLISDLETINPINYSGVSCAIILAPFLTKITKKECGLPHWDQATERQRRDGMCWKDEKELYNNGKPFKLCYRDPASSVVITIIADTYFGYSKKEIKTMISFATNILGFAQEEHAGGCFTVPVYSWGRSFKSTDRRAGLFKDAMTKVTSTADLQALASQPSAVQKAGKNLVMTHTFEEMKKLLGNRAIYQADKGYCVDSSFKNIYYLPENVQIELSDRNVYYQHPDTGADMVMKVKTNTFYILPNGY